MNVDMHEVLFDSTLLVASFSWRNESFSNAEIFLLSVQSRICCCRGMKTSSSRFQYTPNGR